MGLRIGSIIVLVLFCFGLYRTAEKFFLPSASLLLPQSVNSALLTPSKNETAPLYIERVVSVPGLTKEVHAANIVQDKQGQLRAYWYGGSREGSRDVSLYSAEFNAEANRWDKVKPLLDRKKTQYALKRYIKKLGNPVIVKDAQDRLWMFFVSVSVGGWAGSAINYIMSEDNGNTWSPPKRFVASPFLNISTLVKGAPVLFSNNEIGLPVYHEFIGKFSFLLKIDSLGRVTASHRITKGRETIQPIFLTKDAHLVQSFMRFTGKQPNKIMFSQSEDGGVSWSKPKKIDFPNPNSAIAGLSVQNKSRLLVFNNALLHRNVLSLAYSTDFDQPWTIIHNFEHEKITPSDYGFSYPALMQSYDGNVHVLYSWKRKYIKEVVFNQAWLRSQL